MTAGYDELFSLFFFFFLFRDRIDRPVRFQPPLSPVLKEGAGATRAAPSSPRTAGSSQLVHFSFSERKKEHRTIQLSLSFLYYTTLCAVQQHTLEEENWWLLFWGKKRSQERERERKRRKKKE